MKKNQSPANTAIYLGSVDTNYIIFRNVEILSTESSF
jgi:hypothetical protein